MKAIMMSIKPKWVAKILNGEKTIEIRKKFPKDYVGWVYIYCTKGKQEIGKFNTKGNYEYSLNGKVVARFWCDKVEGTYKFYVEELCQLACINKEELYKYAGGWYKTDDLLAIHITKLEIFDKPKEISEFYRIVKTDIGYCIDDIEKQKPITLNACKNITKAPQSYCFIEI